MHPIPEAVALKLQTIDFRLPKPEITERYFLDYEPVQFVAGRCV